MTSRYNQLNLQSIYLLILGFLYAYIAKFSGLFLFDPVLLYVLILVLCIIAGFFKPLIKNNTTTSRTKFFILLTILFFLTASILSQMLKSGLDYSHLRYLLLCIIFPSFIASREQYSGQRKLIKSYFIVLTMLPISFGIMWLLVVKTHFSIFFTEEYRNNYLVLSDCFAILGISILSINPTRIINWIISLICILAIFLLGSRSTMVFGLCSMMFTLFVNFGRLPSKKKIALIAFLGATTTFLAQYIVQNPNFFYRFMSLFNLENDHSKLGRNDLENNFYEKISESTSSILLGSGVYDAGTYIHNFLSIWQFFGIFIFIMFVILTSIVFRVVVTRRSLLEHYGGLMLFSLLSVFVTRGFVSIIFPTIFALIYLVLKKPAFKSD